jgi:CBS domain-containing protein
MEPAPDELLVRDLMSRQVETIDVGDSLLTAARRMRERNVGMLVVTRECEPIGVVTDRDITVRATATDRRPSRTRVREAMTPQLIQCFEDQEIEDAARTMERRAIRRLVVFDRSGRLAGLISVDDIAKRLGDEELAGEVLRHATEPEIQPR